MRAHFLIAFVLPQLLFLSCFLQNFFDFLSEHSGGGGGVVTVQWPQERPHLAAIFSLLHFLSFLRHHLEPFLSWHTSFSDGRGAGGDGRGGSGDSASMRQSHELQSHAYSSSMYEHV